MIGFLKDHNLKKLRMKIELGPSHGRDTGCPAPPAQIPASEIIAPGSSRVFASILPALEIKVKLYLVRLDNSWFWNSISFPTRSELGLIEATSLTSSIKPFVKNFLYIFIKLA